MKWIDVNEELPKKDEDVLCAVECTDGYISIEIRWRTIYEDVVTDDNGFVIYPAEDKVLAWMPIPKYKPKKNY